uniref:Uncharacterized protein n=1 Tax=Panagrolaimus davidi TaxID=227884 RepID=A0A914Q171_9BILA
MSNLLVVINCTLNFFVYTIFGESFRRTLKTLFISQPQAKPLIPKSTNLVWHEDGTNCVVEAEHGKLIKTKSVPITNGEV